MLSNIDNDAIFKLLALLFTVVGWFLKNKFEDRPKLDAFILSALDHPLHAPLFTDKEANTQALSYLRSHAIVLRNSGKKSAKNVRILHLQKPPSFHIFPVTAYTAEATGPNGAFEIVIPVLVPGEQISISYLYGPAVTWNQIQASIKSDEMQASFTFNVAPSTPPSRTIQYLRVALLTTGIFTVLYWAISAGWVLINR